ncbi:MAG: hypothetical protein U0746_03720 [Gemmataceae bacterium]
MPTATPTAANLPSQLAPLAPEIVEFYRELPRLIAEGHTGKIALVKAGQPITVWDTTDDALQAGYDRFGLVAFLAQPIDPADIARLAPYFPAAFLKGA